jgi:hypothetical protein
MEFDMDKSQEFDMDIIVLDVPEWNEELRKIIVGYH